ncbi:MAG TPA: DUF6084 family protein [Rubrobacter sp.]|jgi:hypothetical protein|nr:DUF6084 family protein [Rubrobacter sp.]
MPDLDFEVESADVLPYAALPTILFRLGVQNAVEGEEIDSISLRTQIRIAATQRRYEPEEQAKLRELFGEPHQWKDTLRSLLWTNTNTIVTRFSGGRVFEMPVTCTYDFDVIGTKYFAALEDGEIPLEFLFSGSVFYRKESGPLQVAQISWEKEAKFRLPVRLWREMMDHYFPNNAWIRLHKDTFDRLYEYRSRNALLTWDRTLESLLDATEIEH